MGNLCHPFVPVLVAEIVDHASCCLGKIFEKFFVIFVVVVDCRCKYHMLPVGTDLEAFDSVLFARKTLYARSVGVHAEDLHGVGVCVMAQESDLLSVVDPL